MCLSVCLHTLVLCRYSELVHQKSQQVALFQVRSGVILPEKKKEQPDDTVKECN